MTRVNEELTSLFRDAARWWEAFRNVDASAAEKREFVEWVTRGPDRVEACLHMARVHAAAARADVRWPQNSVEDLVRDALDSPEDSIVTMRPPVRPKHEEGREGGRRPALQWVVGLAASLTVVACLGWWFTFSGPELLETKVGEQRSVMLADGSRVTLNTASKIEVRLRSGRRVVELLRGEALFDVAHDAEHPFDVHAGDIVVRAVGTRFDVDRRVTRTSVTVVEGRVALISAGASKLPVLSAGDRVVVDGAGPGALEHDVNLAEITAWTRQQLMFRHRPLGEIADEFNRYNTAQIEIRSASVRKQEVTGTFRSNDVASFIAVLGGIPGVQVARDSAGGYVVSDDGAN